MSSKTVLVDDLDDRTEGAERVIFYWDGWYEIDVSAKHRADMDKAFGLYVNSARKLPGGPGAGAGGAKRVAAGRNGKRVRSAAARATSADIRAWARSAGIEINDRGRIPGNVVAKYEADERGHALRSAG